jgi:hypothetical protein
MLFKEIERNRGTLFHIFEGGRITLSEGGEFPVIPFENAAGHHFQIKLIAIKII